MIGFKLCGAGYMYFLYLARELDYPHFIIPGWFWFICFVAYTYAYLTHPSKEVKSNEDGRMQDR